MHNSHPVNVSFIVCCAHPEQSQTLQVSGLRFDESRNSRDPKNANNGLNKAAQSLKHFEGRSVMTFNCRLLNQRLYWNPQAVLFIRQSLDMNEVIHSLRGRIGILNEKSIACSHENNKMLHQNKDRPATHKSCVIMRNYTTAFSYRCSSIILVQSPALCCLDHKTAAMIGQNN